MVVSMDRWVDKVAIVTGASSGIGAAIAEALVKHGLTVVGVARHPERIDTNASKLSREKGKLHSFKADIAKEKDVLSLFEWTSKNLGPVHILINNAGITGDTSLLEGETQEWKSVFDLNVLGLCTATREAVKIMKTHKINGHIVYINAILGHQVLDIPNMSVFPASKFAVTALTESLRLELSRQGLKIKITSVSPGLVESDATTFNTGLSQERKDFTVNVPILKSEDVADAVVHVLSTPEHVQVHEHIMRAI